jgi:hypothetical protein
MRLQAIIGTKLKLKGEIVEKMGIYISQLIILNSNQKHTVAC